MFPGQEARYNLFTGPTHFSSSLDGMVCLGERVWSLHNRDGMRCLVERVWGIQKNMFHKLHVQMSCNCKISPFEHHKSQGLVNQPKWKFKSLACHHDPHAFPPPSADKKRIDLQEVGTMIPTVMSGTTASANGMAMIRNHRQGCQGAKLSKTNAFRTDGIIPASMRILESEICSYK
jgi:hypothetical protein